MKKFICLFAGAEIFAQFCCFNVVDAIIRPGYGGGAAGRPAARNFNAPNRANNAGVPGAKGLPLASAQRKLSVVQSQAASGPKQFIMDQNTLDNAITGLKKTSPAAPTRPMESLSTPVASTGTARALPQTPVAPTEPMKPLKKTSPAASGGPKQFIMDQNTLDNAITGLKGVNNK